jgi:hypothetical protein
MYPVMVLKISYILANNMNNLFSFLAITLTHYFIYTTKRYNKGLPEGGCAPFCLGGLKGGGVPLIAKKILDL